jgi:hypothetical protein
MTVPATGEIVTAITVGELTYWEAGHELIVHQERPDGLHAARVDEDGEPVKWRWVPPPPPSRRAATDAGG